MLRRSLAIPCCHVDRRDNGASTRRLGPAPIHAGTRRCCASVSPNWGPRPRASSTGCCAASALASAQRERLSHEQFLHRLIAEQAERRRERSIAHRIREAHLRERKPLSAFDWEFNGQAIDRVQMEELATGAFIERQDNLVF